MNRTRLVLLGLIFSGMVICWSGVTIAAPATTQKLDKVKENIKQKQDQLDIQQQQYNTLNDKLSVQEQKISSLSTLINVGRQTLKNMTQQINELSAQLTKLGKDKAAQQQLVAKQVNLAFRIGPHQTLSSLLEASQSEYNERMLHYAQLMTIELQKSMVTLQQTEKKLTINRQQYESKRGEQQKIIEKLTQQEQTLKQDQQQRDVILKSLKSTLSQGKAQLDKLKAEQKSLELEIKQAKSKEQQKQLARSQVELKTPSTKQVANGLGKPQANLPWPVNGKLLQTYGEAMVGSLQSKGIVIAAPIGTAVKAIAAGKVLLADWLQGYGLVLVIDHGQGDMSVYAYNENVTVSVGQWVTQGEVIAHVGNSVGKKQTGLYFEIRQDGKALNPLLWLKK